MKTSETDATKRADAEEQRFREALKNDYGVSSMFVRVATLSRILGINASTICAAIREQRFCLPHRLVGSSPLVRTDDLVAWYCDPARVQRATEPANGVIAIPAEGGETIDITHDAAVEAIAKDWRAGAVARALSAMAMGKEQ